jgi:hypothetical protein
VERAADLLGERGEDRQRDLVEHAPGAGRVRVARPAGERQVVDPRHGRRDHRPTGERLGRRGRRAVGGAQPLVARHGARGGQRDRVRHDLPRRRHLHVHPRAPAERHAHRQAHRHPRRVGAAAGCRGGGGRGERRGRHGGRGQPRPARPLVGEHRPHRHRGDRAHARPLAGPATPRGAPVHHPGVARARAHGRLHVGGGAAGLLQPGQLEHRQAPSGRRRFGAHRRRLGRHASLHPVHRRRVPHAGRGLLLGRLGRRRPAQPAPQRARWPRVSMCTKGPCARVP